MSTAGSKGQDSGPAPSAGEDPELILAALAGVPDVGDTFTYCDKFGGEHGYRVTCWLRRRPPRTPHPDPAVEEMIQELARRYPPRGHGPDRVPLVFCRREEAEYVGGAGVAGIIVRVSDVRVTGRVNWLPEHIADERRMANLQAGESLA